MKTRREGRRMGPRYLDEEREEEETSEEEESEEQRSEGIHSAAEKDTDPEQDAEAALEMAAAIPPPEPPARASGGTSGGPTVKRVRVSRPRSPRFKPAACPVTSVRLLPSATCPYGRTCPLKHVPGARNPWTARGRHKEDAARRTPGRSGRGRSPDGQHGDHHPG